MKKLSASFLLIILLVCTCMQAAFAEGLPMDKYTGGAEPKKENYISESEYEDSSISVKLYTDRFADTTYNYAHVKISHPSQLRTAPAGMVDSARATFKSQTTARGRLVAKAVNAVVALNGDYHTKSDKCQVVLRMGQQVRNKANGNMDLLVIDMQGNLSALPKCTAKEEYQAYYDANKENMYQVFCFGPLLCQDGVSVIGEDYVNREIGAQNSTQRSAIAQIGPLEYLLITCEGPQSKGSKGMTIFEMAALCEQLGKKHSEAGCSIAFNLDGGNSSTLIFKGLNEKKNFTYVKYNCPDIERFLSDIIYFATLEN